MFLLRPGNAIISTLSKFLIMVLLISQSSCREKREPRNIERSFYYWRTVLDLTDFEKQQLDSLHVKTIYLKFFDVDWDEAAKAPVPVAKLQAANNKFAHGFRVIPTVFITNTCIQKIDPSQTRSLAEKIMQLLKSQVREIAFDTIPEVQIDCDWTASTREKYFDILKNIKRLKPNATLSATIRLHQIKYIAKTGIPPVDRGLLMCYNMGNLKDPATKNSILETAELKKYISNLSAYPLPLDVAFPLFDWKVLYRNNFYTGLIQNLPAAVFNNSFSKQTGNRYSILKDTLLGGYDLRKGDMIRDEQSDINEVLAAAGEIGKHLKNTPLRVSLYHLDSVILSKYTTHELETLYNSLH
ncbi:MAG: hypothetical protein ABIN74_07710 [Ferruginibacter sp.]